MTHGHSSDGARCRHSVAYGGGRQRINAGPSQGRWCKSAGFRPERRSRLHWHRRPQLAHNSPVNSRVHPKYPRFPICLPQMAPLYTRRPPSARNACSSQHRHRPASEAVSSARGDVRSTGGPVFQAFLRYRSTRGPLLRQSDCVAGAARQPAGTGSAQILRSISPKSRRVRCPSASRSQ